MIEHLKTDDLHCFDSFFVIYVAAKTAMCISTLS